MAAQQLSRCVTHMVRAETGKFFVDWQCLFALAGLAEVAGQAHECAGADERIAGLRQFAEYGGGPGILLVSELVGLAGLEGTVRSLRCRINDRPVKQAAGGIGREALRPQDDNQGIIGQIIRRGIRQVEKLFVKVGKTALDCAGDQIDRILKPFLDALILESPVLFQQTPSEPDQRSHRKNGRQQEQPRQFARQAHPGRKSHLDCQDYSVEITCASGICHVPVMADR